MAPSHPPTHPFHDSDWQNPLVFGINKLPPRNSAWPAPDAAAGWASDYDHSPWVLSLNGVWDFSWAPNPSARLREFYLPSFDASAWGKIPVPSCWELEGLKLAPAGQGHYGTPIYSNEAYPFAVDRSPRPIPSHTSRR